MAQHVKDKEGKIDLSVRSWRKNDQTGKNMWTSERIAC